MDTRKTLMNALRLKWAHDVPELYFSLFNVKKVCIYWKMLHILYRKRHIHRNYFMFKEIIFKLPATQVANELLSVLK